MFRLSIPPVVKIFTVVLILIIGIASAVTIYIIRQTNVQTTTKASEPAVATPKKIPWPPVQPTATNSGSKTQSGKSTEETPLPTEKPAAKKVTNPSWVYTGASKISVLPIPNGLKNTLYIKFETDSFTGVSTISYLLTYNSGLTSIVRSAQGSITPSANPIVKDNATKLFAITRSIFLGTCSQNVCTADSNTNSFKLTITVTYDDGTSDGLSLETFTI